VDFGFIPETEQTPDTSGIVRGRSPERNQAGSGDGVPECADRHGEQASEQGSTWNGLAENTLLALVRTGIENDFESVVFPQYPLLREIKRLLMGTPAGVSSGTPGDSSGNAFYAALSGSGSALFGLYRSEADARAAQQRVQATGCKAILTETLPRPEYWRRMFAE
jgi:4-diphosphocytidyl-2-C-methyl-D-erythritol kinase